MTDKQIIEYPHCKDCSEYFICKREGFNRYKPNFIKKTSCRNDCAYDHKCDFGGTPYDCPEFREWCYEDMEVARELGEVRYGNCYEPPLPSIFNISLIKNAIKDIKETGEQIWIKWINR